MSGGSLEAISPDDRLFSEQTRIALSLISLGWEAGELPGSPSGGLTLETRGQIARDISVSGMPANWSFTCEIGHGSALYLSDYYFGLSNDRQRVEFLLPLIIIANPRISLNMRPAYESLIKDIIRESRWNNQP